MLSTDIVLFSVDATLFVRQNAAGFSLSCRVLRTYRTQRRRRRYQVQSAGIAAPPRRNTRLNRPRDQRSLSDQICFVSSDLRPVAEEFVREKC